MSAATRWSVGTGLLLLVGALVAGLALTREPPASPASEDAAGAQPRPQGQIQAQGQPQGQGQQQAKKKGKPRRERIVDTRPLLTARRVAALATSPEEQEFLREVERLADHLVDLTFVDSMRQATDNPPELTPETKESAAQKEKAQIALQADEERIEQIRRRLAAARESDKGRFQDQLDVASAQLELDRDELSVASENLRRAGGDPQARILRLKQVYEAAQKEPRPPPAILPDTTSVQAASVLSRFRAWRWHQAKLNQLHQARLETIEKVERLNRWKKRLTDRLAAEAQARETTKRSAAELASGSDTGPAKAAASTVMSLKRHGEGQRRLVEGGRRIQDAQELVEVYGSWAYLVEGHVRAALHRLLRGVLWVAIALVVVFFLGLVVDRVFRGIARERIRMGTLRTVTKLGVDAIGAIVILVILFGTPAEMTTIVGLAGAGLTVALKDFIMAFFGWFILMRRNGIRVGDWVEIKGVSGEVMEIGLLHTVLLETGNWNDAGHPTGRRVSFVNSFAIEGHYFNFSTVGQWMWDEIRLSVPNDRDPYPIIDGVQKLVEAETQANAAVAEQEWRKTTSRYRVQGFSARPAMNVVPSSGGIEVKVRYITPAHQRHETRQRLNKGLVALMRGKRDEQVTPAAV